MNVENTVSDLQGFLWCLPLCWGVQVDAWGWDHPHPEPHCPRWGHWPPINSLFTNWGISGALKKDLELGAHCPRWAQPPIQSHNKASAAPVHPRNSTFLSKNAAILTYYCLRAHILPPPLENVQPRTSRIQMKICTHIILYLSLWDRDNYSFRMGSKSPDLQRLFEVNIYLL